MDALVPVFIAAAIVFVINWWGALSNSTTVS